MRKTDMSGPNMKTYYLVKFKDNWADEMDLDGFRLMTMNEWDEFVKNINSLKYFPFEVYFGTNEFIEYRNPEEILNRFQMTPLTADEHHTLKQLFPQAARWGYGMFPEFEE
jgi:hypothetical protein